MLYFEIGLLLVTELPGLLISGVSLVGFQLWSYFFFFLLCQVLVRCDPDVNC